MNFHFFTSALKHQSTASTTRNPELSVNLPFMILIVACIQNI